MSEEKNPAIGSLEWSIQELNESIERCNNKMLFHREEINKIEGQLVMWTSRKRKFEEALQKLKE